MKKTLSIKDERVLDKFNEVKSKGLDISKYVTDLVIDDIEGNRFKKEDLVKIIMNLIIMKGEKDSIDTLDICIFIISFVT